MANPISSKPDHQTTLIDDDFWFHLKQAIAASSGFKRWALESGVDLKVQDRKLDVLVRSYLRQTLETLAY